MERQRLLLGIISFRDIRWGAILVRICTVQNTNISGQNTYLVCVYRIQNPNIQMYIVRNTTREPCVLLLGWGSSAPPEQDFLVFDDVLCVT